MIRTLTRLHLRFFYSAFLLAISSLFASAISCYLKPPLSCYPAPPLLLPRLLILLSAPPAASSTAPPITRSTAAPTTSSTALPRLFLCLWLHGGCSLGLAFSVALLLLLLQIVGLAQLLCLPKKGRLAIVSHVHQVLQGATCLRGYGGSCRVLSAAPPAWRGARGRLKTACGSWGSKEAKHCPVGRQDKPSPGGRGPGPGRLMTVCGS
jgi:hypothetical protein